MSIGSRLKEARQRRGLTQAELARQVEVTTSAIGNYETSVSTPREPVLIALMRALGVDANYLYQDDMPIPAQVVALEEIPGVMPVREEERRLLELYRGAEESAQVIAAEILGLHQRRS